MYSNQPVRVTGLPTIGKIVAGGRDGIALDTNGNVWEWGRNKFGELGRGNLDGTDSPHPTPKRVTGIPPVVSVASQGPTVLAADESGNIYAWGFNKWGAVGDGDTTNTGTPQLVLALPDRPSLQLAAAHRSSYAYDAVTGETFAWGENDLGQIGIPANGTPNPIPVNISSEIRPTLPQPVTPPGSITFAFLDNWCDVPSMELLPPVAATPSSPGYPLSAANLPGFGNNVLAPSAACPGWDTLAPNWFVTGT